MSLIRNRKLEDVCRIEATPQPLPRLLAAPSCCSHSEGALSAEQALEILRAQIKRDIDAFADIGEITLSRISRVIDANSRYVDAVSVLDISSNYDVTISRPCRKEVSRTAEILKLFKGAMAHCKSLGREVPDTKVYLYCSDVYAFEDQDLPFLVIAKPRNKTGILVPDNTFCNHPTPHGAAQSWHETKQKCSEKHVDPSLKEPVLFFRGPDTDKGRQDIRSTLSRLSSDDRESSNGSPIFKVNLKGREDLSDFCKYKFLLNLPGNQPWSYRFKYLFLMRSVVVNVDVRQRYVGGGGFNDSWVNAFDVLFEPNVDYINLSFHWKEGDHKYNEFERRKLVDSLRQTYHYLEQNPEEYDRMSSRGFQKVDLITDEIIYEYIYELIRYYSEVISPKLRTDNNLTG